jgi:hypothetical protein
MYCNIKLYYLGISINHVYSDVKRMHSALTRVAVETH